jgi:hypothetical protein
VARHAPAAGEQTLTPTPNPRQCIALSPPIGQEAVRLNGCEGRAQVSSQNTLHPTASRDRLLMMRSSSYSSGGSGGGSDDALGLNCASPMGAPGSES